jgi:hypothetical protein
MQILAHAFVMLEAQYHRGSVIVSSGKIAFAQ